VLSREHCSTSREEVTSCSLIVMLKHPEITEVLGVITVQNSGVASGHCATRDHASQHSTQSQGVLCHGHSRDYIS